MAPSWPKESAQTMRKTRFSLFSRKRACLGKNLGLIRETPPDITEVFLNVDQGLNREKLNFTYYHSLFGLLSFVVEVLSPPCPGPGGTTTLGDMCPHEVFHNLHEHRGDDEVLLPKAGFTAGKKNKALHRLGIIKVIPGKALLLNKCYF